jgi:hypothetical protein
VDQVNLPLEVLALAATGDSTPAAATALTLQAKNSGIPDKDQCTIAARCCACNRWYATSVLSRMLLACSALSLPFHSHKHTNVPYTLLLQEIDAV